MPIYTGALTTDNSGLTIAGINNATSLSAGGQLGLGAQLRYLDAATPLALPSAVPIVIHTPTMFDNISGAQAALKDIIERHSKTIDGIEWQTNIDPIEGYTFKDGQVAEVPGKAVRSQISPTFTFPEYVGRPINEFWRMYSNLILNPDTQFSAYSSFTGQEGYSPAVFSTFCFDIIMIQFDLSLQPDNILGATLITNMWPKEVSPVTYKKDVTEGAQQQEVSVTCTGIQTNNYNTRQLGIEIAKLLNLHKANYNYAINPVDDDYSSVATLAAGYKSEIDAITTDFVAKG
jgi:hypothetical protein